MQIIKHGTKQPKRFICTNCGCEFEALKGEWKENPEWKESRMGKELRSLCPMLEPINWTEIVCECPECGETVKLIIDNVDD